MPNRLGLLHVRPGSERQATEEEEVDKVVAKINDRTSSSSSSLGQSRPTAGKA